MVGDLRVPPRSVSFDHWSGVFRSPLADPSVLVVLVNTSVNKFLRLKLTKRQSVESRDEHGDGDAR